MYKVFYNEHQIILTDSIKEIKKIIQQKHPELSSLHSLPKRIKQLEKDNFPKVILCLENSNKAMAFLYKHFPERKAAGGIVEKKKKLLMIFRKGKWDVPKGHLEKGEQYLEAAEREIKEETGIDKIKFKKVLIPTFHIYSYKGRLVIKHVEWFLFSSKSKNKLVPQEKEDITAVKWMKLKKIKRVRRNTFRSINQLIHFYLENRSKT